MKTIIIILCFIKIAIAAPFKFTIIHTNDLHSHFVGSGPNSQLTTETLNDDPVLGHFGRLKTKIQQLQSENSSSPTLLLDAGDFYSGTLFHTIAPNKKTSQFPEYEFFQDLNYDAITLGNHEFDAGDEGTEIIFNKIPMLSGPKVPILSTNLNYSILSKTQKSIFHKSIIKEYSHNGKKIKFGIIGGMGPDACKVSRGTRKKYTFVGFNDEQIKENWEQLTQAFQSEINRLKKTEKVDIVILVIHAGSPEDEKLAKNLNNLDIIIAGHTHQVYEKPKFINNVYIAQAGKYGEHVGVMNFSFNQKVTLDKNQLKFQYKIDDSIRVDETYQAKINTYIKQINKYFYKRGYQYEQKIFTAQETLIRINQTHNPLGRFITDHIHKALDKSRNIQLYFTTLGLIRQDIKKGNTYLFSDIFKIVPIGFAKNLDPGSPVVSFYLAKDQLRTLIDFLEVYGNFSGLYRPAFSKSLNYSINKWGIPFINRIKNLTLNSKPYEQWPAYIHIATNLFIAKNLDFIEKKTKGLIKLRPVDKNGAPLKNLYQFYPKEYELLADSLIKQ